MRKRRTHLSRIAPAMPFLFAIGLTLTFAWWANALFVAINAAAVASPTAFY